MRGKKYQNQMKWTNIDSFLWYFGNPQTNTKPGPTPTHNKNKEKNKTVPAGFLEWPVMPGVSPKVQLRKRIK